jgi:flagellar protein FliL
MKKIIIIIVVILLLAGGGAAAFFFLQQEEISTATGEAGEAGQDQTGAQLEAKKTDDPNYLDMENLAIPIIRNRRIEKHVILKVSLEMMDEDALEDAKPYMPRLKDAFIKALYDYYSYQSPGAKINTEAIKNRLKVAGDRVVGRGKIQKVLIQAAFQRSAGTN